VTGEIVHDHDIARPQGRGEDLFDIELEPFAVDRTVEEPRGVDAVAAQGGQKGHGSALKKLKGVELEGFPCDSECWKMPETDV
jgi:hypothetical protein